MLLRPNTGAPNNHWGQAMSAPSPHDHYLAHKSKIKAKCGQKWPELAENAPKVGF